MKALFNYKNTRLNEGCFYGGAFRDTSRTFKKLRKFFIDHKDDPPMFKTPEKLDQAPRKFVPQRPKHLMK